MYSKSVCNSCSPSDTRVTLVANTMWSIMIEKGTSLWLRQIEHIHGNLWYRYSLTVNQVVVATVQLSKWWLQLSNYGPLVQHLPYWQQPFFNPNMIGITSSWISCQLRDIYSKCICYWNVATNKWKIHNLKVRITSFVWRCPNIYSVCKMWLTSRK